MFMPSAVGFRQRPAAIIDPFTTTQIGSGHIIATIRCTAIPPIFAIDRRRRIVPSSITAAEAFSAPQSYSQC